MSPDTDPPGADERTQVNPVPPAPVPAPAPAPAVKVGTALPPGTRLHEFEIERTLGEGGFGVVYLARDTQLHRAVAIKEYMPTSLATREPDLSVAVKSERFQETFEMGLKSFINEARLLASFDHPALVKVYRFWEERGTAYMVMPLYQGPTLKAWLLSHARPDADWLMRLLDPLLDALEVLHRDRCYHRDIAPDNILLPAEDRPVLLDFGAARRVIGDATQALTVILKPGYAPIEQYAEIAAMKQGPWTDVYALSAVLYACIGGAAPPPAVGRIVSDDMVSARERGRGRYPEAFLDAIDAGLAVRPEHRPPDMATLRRLLHGEAVWTPPAAAVTGLGGLGTATRAVPGPTELITPPTGPAATDLPLDLDLPDVATDRLQPDATRWMPDGAARPAATVMPAPPDAPALAGDATVMVPRGAAAAVPDEGRTILAPVAESAAGSAAAPLSAPVSATVPPPARSPVPSPTDAPGTAAPRRGLLLAGAAGLAALAGGGWWLSRGGTSAPAPAVATPPAAGPAPPPRAAAGCSRAPPGSRPWPVAAGG